MRVPVFSLLLFLGLFPVTDLHGQEHSCPPSDPTTGMGIVVGQVVDSQTQIPLGFSQVRLRIQGVEAPVESLSNTSGHFEFCSVPSGVLTLSGQLGQLGSLVGPVRLEPGETLQVLLQLSGVSAGQETGTLTGIVIDVASDEGIDGATVLLQNLGQTAVTNAFGRFTFPSLPPGEVDLHVSRMGYGEASGRLEIQEGRTVSSRILLSIEPISLDPISVTGIRRRIELPGLEDFERRFNSGWGQFILEEQIQMRSPNKLTQMFSEYGVTVTGDGKAIRMRRSGCGPMVYIDDVKMTYLPRLKMKADIGAQYLWGDPDESPEMEVADAVNLIHPSDIKAVEIYRGPAETPGQYLDSNAQCGVILIWTRRGTISGR